MVVRPYFRLSLRMAFFRVDLNGMKVKWGGEIGLGKGGKGAGPNRTANREGRWNGVGRVEDAGQRENRWGVGK